MAKVWMMGASWRAEVDDRYDPGVSCVRHGPRRLSQASSTLSGFETSPDRRELRGTHPLGNEMKCALARRKVVWDL